LRQVSSHFDQGFSNIPTHTYKVIAISTPPGYIVGVDNKSEMFVNHASRTISSLTFNTTP